MARNLDQIVTNGLCIGCGLCASIAGPDKVEMRWTPGGVLRPLEKEPLDRETMNLINAACPGVSTSGMTAETAGPGAEHDDYWGYSHGMWNGWAGDPDIRHKAATGGALTALAIHLLEADEVEFIAHMRSPGEAPIRNVPHVSVSREDVLAGMGSRYGPTAPLSNFMAHLEKERPFALVAKPCDISAVRNLAKRDERVGKYCKYLLSISCGGQSELTMTFNQLAKFDLEEDQLTTFRYRGYGCPGLTTMETKGGETHTVSYLSIWSDKRNWHLPWRCKMCMDPIGEQADVIALDIWPGGSPTGEDEGFNGIVARTAKGKGLVERAIAAGALEVEEEQMPFVATMADTQPHQAWKKNGMLGRQWGLFLKGRLFPRYPGLRVIRIGLFKAGLVYTLRQMRGVMQRVRNGDADEPSVPA